jgi:hypothetical protein
MDDLLSKFKTIQSRDWTEYTKSGGLLLLADALTKNCIDLWTSSSSSSSSSSSTSIDSSTVSTSYPSNELALVRDIYNTFLSSFPYCFGYWKKLADNEWRFAIAAGNRCIIFEKAAATAAAEAEADAAAAPGAGISAAEADALAQAADAKIAHRIAIDATVATYERGCEAVAHSPEHWINYCDLRVLICDLANSAGARTVFPLNEAISAARLAFERGLDLCGNDPKADKLWESWLLFETSGFGCSLPVAGQLNAAAKDPQNVRGRARVFAAALASGGPIADKMLPLFRAFASSYPAFSLILTEGDEIREMSLYLPTGVSIPLPQESLLLNCQESDPDTKRDAALRAVLMSRRENAAAASSSFVLSRQHYEALINKRTYFHVKRLEDGPIAAWRDYLSFEETNEDTHEREVGYNNAARIGLPWGQRNKKLTRVEKLYERCLIVTANYGEFWLRYASYCTRKQNVYTASSVLNRASSIFASKRRDIQMALAHALEANGQIAEARIVFESLSSPIVLSTETTTPPSNGSAVEPVKPPVNVEGRTEFAAFLRRSGDLEASYVELVSLASELESGEKEEGEGGDKTEGLAEGDSSGVRSAVLVQAAQTAGLISYPRGLDAFNTAVRSLPKSKLLWCAFADFAEAFNKGNAAAVASVYGSALGLHEHDWLPVSLQQREFISLISQHSSPTIPDVVDNSLMNLEQTLAPSTSVLTQVTTVCLVRNRPIGQLSELDQAEMWLRLQEFVRGPRGNATSLLISTVTGAFTTWRSKHTKAGRPAPEGYIKALALAKTKIIETGDSTSPLPMQQQVGSLKRALEGAGTSESKSVKR